VIVIGVFAFTTGSETLEKESFNKLTAVREMKANQIEDYFQLIENQVITMSEDRMIIEAMRAFDDGLHAVESDLEATDFNIQKADVRVENYYEQEYLPRLIPNLLKDVSVSDYWPENKESRILQDLYMASNPYEIGSKHLLDDPGDGSSYSKVHDVYHPIIRDFLEKFGYHDIFLVDVDTGGHIAYSVFKEVDFGTSLVDGPYADTNFADAYNAARAADDKDYVKIVDYAPYAPSYDAPAAFIASPIFDGNVKIGVLIFQMPIDRIDNIMTSNENWRNVGLGESGETYLFGADFLLRNQSRFLIEDSENYFRMLEDIGVSLLTRARIKNLNSTIGLQEGKTQGTISALQGETGTAIFPDYRGVSVLSAYKSLKIEGLNWAIMSEIDQEEAFASIRQLAQKMSIAVIGLVAVIVVVAIRFAHTLTKPLELLTGTAHELADGNLDVHIDNTDLKDEIGTLASSFDVMRLSMKDLITDLEDINQNLEQKVAERTDELEQAKVLLEKANQRMLVELNFAREIQMSMVPLIFPAFPSRHEFSIFGKLIPAREVGGDFYDFYFVDEDHLCFVVGDVSGKGAAGALLMAVSKTLIKSRALDDSQPSSILTHINDELSRDNKTSMFVTVFLGIINIRTGHVEYTNAGHNPPYIRRADGSLEKIDAFHGPVIGAMPDLTYKQDSVILNKDDIFVLFTDGVTEAMNEAEELFTEERYEKLLKSKKFSTAQKLVDTSVVEVKRHQGTAEQADDITLLALQFNGVNKVEERGRLEVKIKNQIAEMELVEEKFEAFAKQHNITDEVRQKVSVVLDEMLNNVISYAYRDEKEHIIEVVFVLTSNRLMVTIRDDGRPFNPFGLEPPAINLTVGESQVGGLGVHLVRSIMDEYMYQRQIGKNVITLAKLIDK